MMFQALPLLLKVPGGLPPVHNRKDVGQVMRSCFSSTVQKYCGLLHEASWTNSWCIHTCLVGFVWNKLKFISPLGADLLGRCEYSNRTRVQTKQPYRDPAEEVVSVRFQTNSGTVEWMNQWMDDLKHTCGFVYSFCFTCKKGSVKVNRTKQNQHWIWSGPKQVN